MSHRHAPLWLALGLCGGLLAAASASGQTVNPYPRQLLKAEPLVEWTFDAGPDGWAAINQCRADAADGALKITCTGDDPYLAGPAVRCDGPLTVTLRMKCAAAGKGQVFWATQEEPGFAEERSARFSLLHDGQWHDYAVPLEATGTLTRLRLDPGSAPGTVEIDRMGLARVTYHPLELVAVEQAPGKIHLDLKNHSDKAIDITVGSQRQTLEAKASLRVSAPDEAARPFEARTVTVESPGLPPLTRTLFLYRPQLECAWLTLKSQDTALRVAPDGSGARLDVAGTAVAVLVPLVHRDGVVPALRTAMPAAGAAPRLTFHGDGTTVDLSVDGDEVTVTLESDKPVEGPVVRALGPLRAGLFAGLEYLGAGERSSSTLDIETPEHLRYAPDLLKVTLPLMAAVTDRGLSAVVWKDMALQPVFASPNFFDGAADQRMALRGTRIEATVLVRRGATLEDAIVWAVRKRGLPPLPAPPRSPADQEKLCLAAFNGPIQGDGGWGHCAEPSWKRQPFADIASTLWRLTGKIPAIVAQPPAALPPSAMSPTPGKKAAQGGRAANLVPGGGHVRNDAIYFVTGRAADWLRVRSGEVKGILAAQKEDGSWRYTGQYQRGHNEDTSSGFCAHKAAILLDYARLTGDPAARDGGLRALDYMRRFDVPRGAQTWELSLHTPDVLASAYLVWSYARGYELTGKAEHLAAARRWAVTGVPFVYQWGKGPIMPYATIAVYGATNWRAPNWMGLPVQWCGGVYAYALTLLAPHDQTLDWRQLARGILISAQQQQAPDGPMIGCLPDSFDLAAQRRQGPFINPSALLCLQWALDGQPDSLVLAADANHRVASPYPVKIEAGKAVIQAKKGAAYQIVVDGNRVVDVKSAGTDTVALE